MPPAAMAYARLLTPMPVSERMAPPIEFERIEVVEAESLEDQAARLQQLWESMNPEEQIRAVKNLSRIRLTNGEHPQMLAPVRG